MGDVLEDLKREGGWYLVVGGYPREVRRPLLDPTGRNGRPRNEPEGVMRMMGGTTDGGGGLRRMMCAASSIDSARSRLEAFALRTKGLEKGSLKLVETGAGSGVRGCQLARGSETQEKVSEFEWNKG